MLITMLVLLISGYFLWSQVPKLTRIRKSIENTNRHKTISFMPHILAYKNEFYEGLDLYV